ncbi:TIGR02688 family protein [Anoxybacter fermentans]|uniref:TIGR02688 family protein n=1 Tax=Anoxybacter fermentans TaxID=1323375 RepID=A0A3S9T0X7_9FIRM|nr:BREX system Lon protease-like protein BrxL [Anoxybacter fermentans]AZR74201.1 TIGR02688 family protein [Anoxybacter fermentans]
MALIDHKVEEIFPGEFISKNLVSKFKKKLNIPVYILENLILRYQKGEMNEEEVERITQILQERMVNPKENLKVQARIRDEGSLTIIDKVTATVIRGQNKYWAELINLGAKKVTISNELIRKYPDLLENGLWAEVKIRYLNSDATKESEFEIKELTSLQRTTFDFEEFKEKVSKLANFLWFNLLLRSIGIEPFNFTKRKKLLFLARLIPFVEKNYNFIELGARGTGKSYIYRQLSSESILVSGGKTTVANLFYNMGTGQLGLVGKREVVAFDEVAYIDFKDRTAIQILKDYMESGSFSRGKEIISAEASMVFLGNINQDIQVLLQKSHLFEPLPQLMQDLALIDRFHFYLPGWEMEILKERDFTTHYGLKCDYLALAMSKLRELDFTDVIDDYFIFDKRMNARDKRAVKKTVSGFLKLLHPSGQFTKEDLKLYLDIALEGRKRIKEQLIKMGSFEYKETSFEYIDRESQRRYFPILPEACLDTGFKRRLAEPGVVYIGQILDDGHDFALLKLKVEYKPGSGRLFFNGEINQSIRNHLRKTFIIIKNRKLYLRLRQKIEQNDFYVTVTPLINQIEADISNAFFIAIYSLLTNKSVSAGLLVTEKSSIYRKPVFHYELRAIKAEGENGQIKILLPLKKDHIFVEIPREVIAEVPYFITV